MFLCLHDAAISAIFRVHLGTFVPLVVYLLLSHSCSSCRGVPFESSCSLFFDIMTFVSRDMEKPDRKMIDFFRESLDEFLT